MELKKLIEILKFKPVERENDRYYKTYPQHNGYIITIDFELKKIDYGSKIKVNDKTTSNFSHSENFVVLECVNRLLEKGYLPENISLEEAWLVGRKEKGKLDILVRSAENASYLMIECKTWGREYDKEIKKMKSNGGQLFSYFQQDTSTEYLCLYSSTINNYAIEYRNDIIKVENSWRKLNNQKEVFEHWNKNFKDNGIFEEWATPYDVTIKSLTRGQLKELTHEDSSIIFNQFLEILRHNVVSDKPNAFNKILNLFICKIIDEDRGDNIEVMFQWKDDDTHETLQTRLNDLYRIGMKRFLNIEVTDYTEEQLETKLYNISTPQIKQQLQQMFLELRLQKNPEFAFKEVFNEQSFIENAIVVKEVVELLQPYQFRYGHKQQFLGNFFELLLNTSIKQESGQFFTPVPIAKFIVSCFPIASLIEKSVKNNSEGVLPYTIDYATGSGHFLTEWMDYVQEEIEKIDSNNFGPTLRKKFNAWKIDQFSWASEYVYGIEADYRLVKTAKVSSFLNGDGEANIVQGNGLDHFQYSEDYRGRLKKVSTLDNRDNAQFDIVIANPPYSVSAFKNTIKKGAESFELFKYLTDESSEIECLFIERTKQLLIEGGMAGVILPSSILNNTGVIFVKTRELLLKYFNIKAIVELGNNTFMATTTNTIILFLERKSNNSWKIINNAIDNFLKNPKDATVNSIEKAFSKYTSKYYPGITFEDFISLIKNKPSSNLRNNLLFKDYLEIIKIDNDSTEGMFTISNYDKVIKNERLKMLSFFLTYDQEVLLIKSGRGKEEKNFLGYEFSTRRGHEGIRMLTDNKGKLITKLYGTNNEDPEKINSYIMESFKGEKIRNIHPSIKNNIFVSQVSDLLDYRSLTFTNKLSLNPEVYQKKSNSQYFQGKKLSEYVTYEPGVNFDKADESNEPTQNKIYTATNINKETRKLVHDEVTYLNDDIKISPEKILKKDDIFICTSSGSLSHLGKNVLIEENINVACGGFCAILRSNNRSTIKYIYYMLNSRKFREYINKFKGSNINNLGRTNLLNFQVPVLSENEMNRLVNRCSDIEEKKKMLYNSIDSYKKKINEIIENLPKKTMLKNVLIKRNEKIKPSEYPEVSLNNIGLAEIEPNTGRLLPFEPSLGANIKSEKNVFYSGDLLYGRLRPYLNKVHIASFNGICSTEILVLKPQIPANILKYIMLHEDFVKSTEKLMTGNNLPRISQTNLLKLEIPIPEESKIQKISKLIEECEHEIEFTKKEIEKYDEELKELVNSLYNV